MKTSLLNTFFNGAITARACKAVATALIAFASFTNSAMAQDCLVSSLNISTGVDHTGALLPTGTSDPRWNVTCLSAGHEAIAGPAPFPAWVVPTINPPWALSTTSGWIGITGNGYTQTDENSVESSCFTRCFTVCNPGDFKIDFEMAADDQITTIELDGVSIYSGQPYGDPDNYGTFNSTLHDMKWLDCGEHCITFKVTNISFPFTNATGLNLKGFITAVAGGSLVSEDPKCARYVCACCEDKCFWKVTGNNIHSGNNYFGTRTNDDIRIISNSVDRAVVQAGGNIGIKQLAPTTTFDVDCVPTTAPSGLRFENLPVGHGHALVVDNAGYVHVAQSILYRQSGDNGELETEVKQLRQELSELKARLGMNEKGENNSLKVSPNPTDGKMTIAYTITSRYNSAQIQINDVQGRQVQVAQVTGGSGNTNIILPVGTPSGDFVVTLVIDGKASASQKVVLAR